MSDSLVDYNKFRIIRNHPEIGRGEIIAIHPELIKIGGLVTFDLTADVTIEDNVEISFGAVILTHRHHWRHSRGLRALTQTVTTQSLRICEDAFIGINAIIYGIARIGKGAIIGAGAKVKRDVGDFEIWDGNPAVCIGVREG
jgi:acetyltransferase-like isoleucine patch superfamily enzyme